MLRRQQDYHCSSKAHFPLLEVPDDLTKGRAGGVRINVGCLWFSRRRSLATLAPAADPPGAVPLPGKRTVRPVELM